MRSWGRRQPGLGCRGVGWRCEGHGGGKDGTWRWTKGEGGVRKHTVGRGLELRGPGRLMVPDTKMGGNGQGAGLPPARAEGVQLETH